MSLKYIIQGYISDKKETMMDRYDDFLETSHNAEKRQHHRNQNNKKAVRVYAQLFTIIQISRG